MKKEVREYMRELGRRSAEKRKQNPDYLKQLSEAGKKGAAKRWMEKRKQKDE